MNRAEALSFYEQRGRDFAQALLTHAHQCATVVRRAAAATDDLTIGAGHMFSQMWRANATAFRWPESCAYACQCAFMAGVEAVIEEHEAANGTV